MTSRFEFTRVYPDGRRPFNLADYMKGKPKSRPRNNTDDLTYYKYYTGATNKDGTQEYEIVKKEGSNSPKPSGKGITLADLMRDNRKYPF
jgi:hypothetical protein